MRGSMLAFQLKQIIDLWSFSICHFSFEDLRLLGDFGTDKNDK